MQAGQDYRGGLSPEELVGTLQDLLAAEQRAMRLTCRYLADLADCMEARGGVGGGALAGYADVYHAARCLFGLGAHTTRERIRVGRALRALPRIEEALLSRELSYSRVREVTRVATADDESVWLLLGRELPIRTLERRVAEAAGRGPNARTPAPAHARRSSSETVEVTLHLPAATWALVQRAMEGARRASEASLSDAEALAAVARDALARQSTDVHGADLRRAVVLYECQSCARTELDMAGGAMELGAGAAAALGCGAHEWDLRTEGRAVQRGGPLPAAIERAVRLRDRNTCRVPGCLRRRYVDVHHILFQSQGGEPSRSNCVCLCTTHHGLHHDGRLRIEGDAEGELVFHDETGALLTIPAASHCGTSAVSGASVDRAPTPAAFGPSHSGTAGAPGASPRGGATDSDEASTLLALIGRGGRWSVDALVDASGLRVNEVQSALTVLEIERRIKGGWTGVYEMRAREAPFVASRP
ncbi:MAG: hypothetical protein R3B70_31085 [Polyangiaceae bacterium]